MDLGPFTGWPPFIFLRGRDDEGFPVSSVFFPLKIVLPWIVVGSAVSFLTHKSHHFVVNGSHEGRLRSRLSSSCPFHRRWRLAATAVVAALAGHEMWTVSLMILNNFYRLVWPQLLEVEGLTMISPAGGCHSALVTRPARRPARGPRAAAPPTHQSSPWPNTMTHHSLTLGTLGNSRFKCTAPRPVLQPHFASWCAWVVFGPWLVREERLQTKKIMVVRSLGAGGVWPGRHDHSCLLSMLDGGVFSSYTFILFSFFSNHKLSTVLYK